MSTHRLVLGFLPLLDCAPLVVAEAKGYAAAERLELELVRESSWANIRDRVIVGQFHAAHMLGPMAIASSLGIGHLQVPMIAPMALGLGGNAITVSAPLWDSMHSHGADSQTDPAVPGATLAAQGAPAVRGHDPAAQGAALKRAIQRRGRGAAPLTFAMVYPFSTHNYQLRYWLAAAGIDPDEEVRLVVIPPPLMVDALRCGQVDGFCVGEPWNSLAVENGVGRIVTPTSAIWRQGPDKVLGMRADWAEAHAPQVQALLRALQRASHWCDRPESRAELADLLAEPRFVGESATLLERGLAGRLPFAPAAPARDVPDFLVYARHWATFPWVSHAQWFYTQMVRWRQVTPGAAAAAAARAAYRPDLLRTALQPLAVDLPAADAANGAQGAAFFDGAHLETVGPLQSLGA